MLKLKDSFQTPPFTVQIEPTEGCNLGCSFCGIRGIRKKGTKPWNFMSVELAERIASQIAEAGWTSKIVFAMHGEPTLNIDLFEIIKTFRDYLPNNIFYVISNGYGIVNCGDIQGYCELLAEVGVNNLILDNYSPNGDWSKVIKEMEGKCEITFMEKGVPMFSGKKDFNILVMPNISEDKIAFVRVLNNHCGAAFPPSNEHNKKRCTLLFRELAFRWDGNVAICCEDFRGQYPIANIKDIDLIPLWNHERFQAARIMIYNRERDFFPCNICSSVSSRVGLLPDQLGKEEVQEITDEVREIAQSVSVNNEPLSTIVLRKWEK